MSIAEFTTTFSPTTTAALRRPRRTQLDRAAKGAVLGAVAAVPPITALHLSATDPIEPSGWTISDYVVSLPQGILQRVAGAAQIVLLAMSAIALLRSGRRPPRTASSR